jgi:hypothetical protein
MIDFVQELGYSIKNYRSLRAQRGNRTETSHSGIVPEQLPRYARNDRRFLTR